MTNPHPRIVRESKTIAAMIELYCTEQHSIDGALCPECADLHEYAQERLRRCPFQEKKSTCAKCTVHCYKADMRERVRVVMRYAGPRMMLHHPVMAVQHIFDGMRKPPVSARSRAGRRGQGRV